MRAHLALIVAAAAGFSAVGCTTSRTTDWVRTRDDAQGLKSALYWCRRVEREKFYKQGTAAHTRREKNEVVNEKCMAERGWRPGK